MDIDNLYNDYKRNSSFSFDEEFVYNEKAPTPTNEQDNLGETENLNNYYCRDNVKEKTRKEKDIKKEAIDTIVVEKKIQKRKI